MGDYPLPLQRSLPLLAFAQLPFPQRTLRLLPAFDSCKACSRSCHTLRALSHCQHNISYLGSPLQQRRIKGFLAPARVTLPTFRLQLQHK